MSQVCRLATGTKTARIQKNAQCSTGTVYYKIKNNVSITQIGSRLPVKARIITEKEIEST